MFNKKQDYKNEIFKERYKENKKYFKIKSIEEFDKSILADLTQEFNEFDYREKNFFAFPEEYIYINNKKMIFDYLRTNGNLIEFHEDNIVILTERNKTKHLIFEDGAILTTFNNNDERLILPNGGILFNHKNANTLEINYADDNFSLVRYLGGFVEKLFHNGIKLTKNSFSKEAIIAISNDKCYKMFNNNGRLLELNFISNISKS